MLHIACMHKVLPISRGFLCLTSSAQDAGLLWLNEEVMPVDTRRLASLQALVYTPTLGSGEEGW